MIHFDSFSNLRVWLDSLKDCVGEDNNIQLIVLGNKCDLEDQIEVSEEELKMKADELGVEYFLTSAKTGQNIEEAFDTIFQKVYGSVYSKKGFALGDKGNHNDDSRCCR